MANIHLEWYERVLSNLRNIHSLDVVLNHDIHFYSNTNGINPSIEVYNSEEFNDDNRITTIYYDPYYQQWYFFNNVNSADGEVRLAKILFKDDVDLENFIDFKIGEYMMNKGNAISGDKVSDNFLKLLQSDREE